MQTPPAPASVAPLHLLLIPGKQNSFMGCDPVLMELGKPPDSKISKLGAGEEADRSQVHPAGIASATSEIRFSAAYISCHSVDQWSDANLQ